MATYSRDAVDMAAVPVGGTIREDVMEKIWNIDPEEREFHDRAGTDTATNQYHEFVQEDLDTRNMTNAQVDGMDAGSDTGATERRVGNYHQISEKVVVQSHRAQQVDSVGNLGKLLRRVMIKQKALRLDCEAIALSRQAAQAGDGNEANIATTGPGKTAGVATWIQTNYSAGATGSAGQMSDNTNKAGYPSVAPVDGTARALSDATVKAQIQATYLAGGDVSVAMSAPQIIKAYSEFHFGTSAKIATLQSDKPQGAPGQLTAYGSVNVLATDFGITLELVPNRQQQTYSGAADLFLLDMEYWNVSYIQGYRTDKLGKTGKADKRLITVDWAVNCTAEKANACVADLDITAAVTA